MKNANKKGTFFHHLGDRLERLGEKISNVGAIKIGKKIYNAGNKLEHMFDRK